MRILGFIVLNLLLSVNNFGQEKLEELDLKFRGSGSAGTIAIIVSNKAPVFVEINHMMREFIADGLKVALVPEDYDYDLTKINKNNSPFGKEVEFVMKINVLNDNNVEQVINTTVEILKIDDEKIVSKDLSGPRSNIKILVAQIQKLLGELIPSISVSNSTITAVKGEQFFFVKDKYSTLKKGDEVMIRYQEPRDGLTESFGVIQRISNDMFVGKDLNKKVQVNDTIIKGSPQRNRFSLSTGLMIPSLGEKTIVAQFNNNQWQSQTSWPVGFKLEGEYERLFPYQLTSTTAFGISVDRILSTYLMTGVGYRVLVKTWEFIPYFRIGVLYTPLSLSSKDGGGDLQGFALRFGLNIGISMIKRLNNSMFIGLDIGAQYFPWSYVPVILGTEKITPQWKNSKGIYADTFPMTSLYPYLNLKMSWIF